MYELVKTLNDFTANTGLNVNYNKTENSYGKVRLPQSQIMRVGSMQDAGCKIANKLITLYGKISHKLQLIWSDHVTKVLGRGFIQIYNEPAC